MRSEAFWAEMSACDHLVQIYEADDAFLDSLTGFVGGALRAGQGAIVIATPEHRHQLDSRLRAAGVDVDGATLRDQFISVDAEATLAMFTVKDWPNEKLFATVVIDLLRRAGADGRKVRAFGEMVALLWARGLAGATVQLEHLWRELCEKESFSLFCAYPKIGFTESPSESIARVCSLHSKVLDA
jgi:hypothetical protein